MNGGDEGVTERIQSLSRQAEHLRELWDIYRDREQAYREASVLVAKAELVRFRLEKLIRKEKK